VPYAEVGVFTNRMDVTTGSTAAYFTEYFDLNRYLPFGRNWCSPADGKQVAAELIFFN
jgi:hypothetical protein